MPDTVEDDSEESIGHFSDDLESAVPTDNIKEGVKFGWIRGVLVSYAGIFCAFAEFRLPAGLYTETRKML